MEEKQIYGCVYLVKNLVNGKMYFGITEYDFDSRYSGNIAKHTHNDHLRRSIEKHGIENFEINKEFDVAYNEDDLYDLEDMYICLYNTLDEHYGYNKRRSGSKHKGNGKASDESKKKMSESHKGKQHTEETKQKISEVMKGKILPEDTKRKMSKVHKGKPKSGEHKQHISEAMTGKPRKPFSEEHRQHLSEAKKGKKGKPHSEEAKQKISEAQKVKVICLETKQVFDSVKQAQEWLGKGNIIQHLRGNSKSAGKHPITKEPLHWQYYEDYLKLQEEQQNSDNLDTNNKIA